MWSLWPLGTCPLLGDDSVSLTCDFLSHHSSFGSPCVCAAFSTGPFSSLFESCPKQRPLMGQQRQIPELFPHFWGSLSSFNLNKPRPCGGTLLNGTGNIGPLLPPATGHSHPCSRMFSMAAAAPRGRAVLAEGKELHCVWRGDAWTVIKEHKVSLQSTGSC